MNTRHIKFPIYINYTVLIYMQERQCMMGKAWFIRPYTYEGFQTYAKSCYNLISMHKMIYNMIGFTLQAHIGSTLQ